MSAGRPQSAATEAPRRQCADAVLMVRPAAFGFNPETAHTNAFQRRPEGPADASAAARSEFAQLVQALRSEGVAVCVVEDTPKPVKPDAVFPNNWLSFHADGTVVRYPMESANRRPERRDAVVEAAARELGFTVQRVVDLSPYEKRGQYLEGTGSLILDHVQRVAYACLSPRTHPQVVEAWARELEFEAVTFAAADASGVPFYHTNVLLAIGERAVVVGAEAIASADRARVLARLGAGGRDVITIGQREITAFAGNVLELGTWDEALGDARVLVMSASARRVLDRETYARLSGCTDTVLAVPVPTIESLGGGSVRCMLAEVFRAS